MTSESGWVENKGNDPLSSRTVGLTIYSLKVSTDPEAAPNWTCLDEGLNHKENSDPGVQVAGGVPGHRKKFV